MATIQDVMHTISPGLAQLPFYDGQEPPDSYYQKLRAVNEMAQPEFLNWLQGKYRDVMVGTNQAQGHVYAEILPYLYNHLPDALEMRVRIAAPADLDAFFNKLCNKWYENIAVRLGYTGDITNPIAIHGFIESDLTRRLNGQTQYLRRDHFGTGQVKKVTKTTKSSPKHHCSNCGRTGHSKNKCPQSKRTKKVNNTHIVDYEESESDEETDEETEEELTEEEEEEDEPQNCFSRTYSQEN
ncbi:hypothetical protein RhiirA1_466012 [Rhizophagus irregularis]|uniref:CCHC-type domain-containing protein n=1 Tax=Rhizophagus irregularis TaxID=588596 RepID=A0A2N0RER5_9GLOM|nr:hypothetical protein RhiirA1_466012 [Rhizophagus irregularis]